jgi:iron(III) transport system ATP-binding protein
MPNARPSTEDAAGGTTSRSVTIAAVAQHFGATRVLDGIDLDIRAGEFIALLGPSGCGKTTLLRLVAGLSRPTEGRILIGGEVVADAAGGRFVPPERRGLGMVFQDYGLWPHMTVGGNVAFPLEMQRLGKAECGSRVEAALARVGLAGFAGRGLASLSGGQQQRVALARAIVGNPGLVLFDEPLSNLDKELRDTLGLEIAHQVRSLGTTAIYVTHDQGEAMAMADRIALVRQGRLLQVAAPERLVDAPATAEVAEFLQLGTLSRAERSGEVLHLPGGLQLPVDQVPGQNGERHGRLLLPRRALRALNGDGRSHATELTIEGTVSRVVFRGGHFDVAARLGATAEAPEVLLDSEEKLVPGSRLTVGIAAERLRWFPAA